MIPAHRHKMPTWYHITPTASPDLKEVQDRIKHVSHKTLKRAHGCGLPCCKRR